MNTPTLWIQPSSTPFRITALDELQPLEVARVVKTCASFEQLLSTTPLPDPATLLRFASEVVGLHKRLQAGATRLAPATVERFARWPGHGGEARARRELMHTLEAAYAAVEPRLP